ncbi:uncharacterized protein PV09_00269 [Verruconis gallopava]|uniref:Association with the SNF1 complex (ASC) domain-containing protein n=1 Tax=Verruconis gallopava TaxID=253628 RepID=A0A0D2ARP8_9PEZI|nr:uncharacterized protein PV09_00269 [Verruconis gallopava]KIW09373.1 hypothetical protein PV09_00269 [Verruconis gallopava]
MGNQESKPSSSHQSGVSSSQPPSHASNHATTSTHTIEKGKSVPRRRQSVQASLSGAKATASPSASLASATATTSNSSKGSAEDYLKRAAQPQAQPNNTSTLQFRPIDIPETMGTSSSKPVSIERTTPQTADPASPPSPLSRPIDVPTTQSPAQSHAQTPSPPLEDSSGFVDASYQLAAPQFSRPPRLPLPIEEEVHVPGSPIISPADISAPIGPIEGEIALPRRASVLSSTTVDDDDLGDDVNSLEPWNGATTVPTLLEWREEGEKVYVTGTFAGWDKKFRLHRNGPSKHPGALSAMINLVPGTHHVRFIVDNEMKLSKFLPTAVDFTNFLINYIEVVPPQPAESKPDSDALQQSAAAAVPPQVQSTQVSDEPSVHTPQAPPVVAAPAPSTLAPRPDATPKAIPRDPRERTSSETLASQVDKPKMAPIAVGPPKKYHTQIPQFLLDIEAEDDQALYARASALISTLPEPPSLPMFLGKSVLNGATPMKDDASVLVMPNHTVLNHLATSSIKNKVLATSATTRYKKKFLTTIMYKPTTQAID